MQLCFVLFARHRISACAFKLPFECKKLTLSVILTW